MLFLVFLVAFLQRPMVVVNKEDERNLMKLVRDLEAEYGTVRRDQVRNAMDSSECQEASSCSSSSAWKNDGLSSAGSSFSSSSSQWKPEAVNCAQDEESEADLESTVDLQGDTFGEEMKEFSEVVEEEDVDSVAVEDLISGDGGCKLNFSCGSNGGANVGSGVDGKIHRGPT